MGGVRSKSAGQAKPKGEEKAFFAERNGEGGWWILAMWRSRGDSRKRLIANRLALLHSLPVSPLVGLTFFVTMIA
jgi:hypothetical protein